MSKITNRTIDNVLNSAVERFAESYKMAKGSGEKANTDEYMSRFLNNTIGEGKLKDHYWNLYIKQRT